MRDCFKIEDVEFEYNGEKLIPVQTFITPYGEVYIKFKRIDGTFLNVHSTEVKNYIKNEVRFG
jgi:hypothetical protein